MKQLFTILLVSAVAIFSLALTPQQLPDRLPAHSPERDEVATAAKKQRPVALRFRDVTSMVGLDRYTWTFGAAVTTFSPKSPWKGTRPLAQDLDDLVISNHGLATPSIYLNEGGRFRKTSDNVLGRVRGDLHGIAVVDLNNDGYREILVCGGGDDGVGDGDPNFVFLNTTGQQGEFSFSEIAGQLGLVLPPHRSRQFIPLPGAGGGVDLYLVARTRPGTTNLYLRNTGNGDVAFERDASFGLNRNFNNDGRADTFVDWDDDGDLDFFMVEGDRIRFFENRNGAMFVDSTKRFGAVTLNSGASARRLRLVNLRLVTFLQAGDVDGDGLPDLYIGTRARNRASDQLSSGILDGEARIHFVFKKNSDADSRELFFFTSPDNKIKIDFIAKKGLSTDDASMIYIGKNNLNPPSREATISAQDANGKPQFVKPGIYIWRKGTRWSVEWYHYAGAEDARGAIISRNISDVKTEELELFEPELTQDMILINKGRGKKRFRFSQVDVELAHRQQTRAGAWGDFNNDGTLDFVGMRGQPGGALNGNYFILINRGLDKNGEPIIKEQKFNSLDNSDDDLGQADCLVVGHFDDDGLLDIVTTSGWGIIPGNLGPIKAFHNATPVKNDYVIIELKGTTSNSDALGTKVRLFDKRGNPLSGAQWLGLNYNRMQNTHKIHFGLGGSSPTKIFAEINWPGGTEQRIRVRKNVINYIAEPGK